MLARGLTCLAAVTESDMGGKKHCKRISNSTQPTHNPSVSHLIRIHGIGRFLFNSGRRRDFTTGELNTITNCCLELKCPSPSDPSTVYKTGTNSMTAGSLYLASALEQKFVRDSPLHPTRALTEFKVKSPGARNSSLCSVRGQRHCLANLPIKPSVWRARRLSGRSPPPGPGLLWIVIRAPGKYPPQHGVERRRPLVSHDAFFLRRHLLESPWARDLQVLFPPFGRFPHTVPSLRGPCTLQQITSKNLHPKSFSCRHLAWSGKETGREAPELRGIAHWPASTHRRQGCPSWHVPRLQAAIAACQPSSQA